MSGPICQMCDQKEDLKGLVSCEQRKIISSTASTIWLKDRHSMHDFVFSAGVLLGKVTYFYAAYAAVVYRATMLDACWEGMGRG